MAKQAAVWNTILIVGAAVVCGITLAFVIAGLWTPAPLTLRNYLAATYILSLVVACAVLVISLLQRRSWYAWGFLLLALALAAKVFGPEYHPLSTEFILWQSSTSLLGLAGGGLVVWAWQKQRSIRTRNR